jgi:hypothetical protein
MRQPSAITIFDLGDHPELAALEILEAAIATAKLSVLAVHTELVEADDEIPTDLESLAAEQLLTAATALERAITVYRVASTSGASWRRPHQPDPADTPF